LNVTATDKSTNKNAKITITNNKGRLSKDEIERLVKEAEKFKGEDEMIKKRIESKNTLESYTFSIRNSLKDEKLKDKFKPEEKEKVEKLVEETQKWLETNQEA